MKSLLGPLLFAGLALAPASGGVFSLGAPFTDDPSSLINPSNTYTHAISGGTVATVNGVNFQQLSPGIVPPNFSWDSSTGGFNDVIDNFGQWIPSGGGVTGTGLIDLLESFTYSGNGANAGSSQTFTLSGLIAGTTYDTRLYQRVWDKGTSGRPIDVTISNGADVGLMTFEQDRPGNVLGTGNQDQAYYINYRFTAQGTDLVINMAVPPTAPFNSGSYHMYALTNQVVPEPAAGCLVLAITLLGSARRRR
jgi:fibronectin-binding autotransporter adhesin